MVKTEKLFGTDGIRGTPGVYPLTDEMISRIGRGAACWVRRDKAARKKPKVLIGKDTRLSGHKIESQLADAFIAQGIDVLLAGTITTPGLAYFTKELQANMGVMISASHNKASDNGIKFFNANSYKLNDEEEAKIEDIIFSAESHKQEEKKRQRRGRIRQVRGIQSKYIKFLISTLNGAHLKGIHIALDCASGAASLFAKKLFRKLGAKVYAINDTPHGDNINIGGAIDPSFVKALVHKTSADIGIAVDGDGDRGILVDETGHIIDGDCTVAIIARYLLKKNMLRKNTVVGTLMSNYGLKVALEECGGKLLCTPVGDKYVLEALVKNNLNLGGEQSGHIIFLDYLSTPDGLLTALQILKVMRETGVSLSELAKCVTKFPQILVNIKVREKRPFEQMPVLNEKLRYFNSCLKGEGRILLRYSGTESLARVMVEGRDKGLIENIAHSLAEQIQSELGDRPQGDTLQS